MATTTVPQPLKWFGGKGYMAPKIIELMPPHLHYVEPFFGGGAVLLEKSPEGVSEVVNDLNGDLTNFWNVLKEPGMFAEFSRRCEVTPFSESAWQNAYNRLQLPKSEGPQLEVKADSVERAVAFFVHCRQSRAGQFKDFATLSRTRVRRGMNEQVSAWLTALGGLSAVHRRLQRVVILNRPALDVIRQQDGPSTLFYLDPPYLHSTRTGNSDYAHEMTDPQHHELLELLRTIKGKFLLSGYHSPLYCDQAAACGWRVAEFEIDNKAAGGKSKRKMIECVWMNY